MKILRLVSLFTFIILSNLSLSLQGQNRLKDLSFRTISPKGGFTDKGVEDIVKDQLGFLWIGTRGGLYRYDGYEFKKYVHSSKDSSSLSGDGIRDLLIDGKNRLWIATNEGLNLYNRAHDSFQKIKLNNRSTGSVVDLELDRLGNLYLACNSGIYRYNHENEDAELIKLPYNDIRKIQLAHNGQIYAAFVKNGVLRVNKSGKLKRIVTANDNSLRAFFFANKKLYLGYESEGLRIFNSSGDFLSDLTLENKKISHNKVNKIYKDKEGNIWIGTYGGLDIIAASGDIYHHAHRILDPYSIPFNSVYGIYEDSENNFWIGTYSGGLAYHNEYENKFQTVNQNPGVSSITSNYITCFTADKHGNLYIGTGQGGLNKQNSKNLQFNKIELPKNNPEAINIKSLLTTSDNRIFVGTYRGGVYYLDANRFAHRVYIDGIERDEEKVYALLESDYGIWIGDYNEGLFLISGDNFTPQKHYKQGNDSFGLTSSKITSLCKDGNNLWVGTGNGLNLIIGNESSVAKFKYNKTVPNSISSDDITMISKDIDGNIWIGTRKGGINRYLKKEKIFVNYTMEDGLSGNDANGILCDNLGFVWVSTENGISRIDPLDGSITNYNVSDGIQGNQFNQSAAFAGTDGRLFFGGTNGYTIIAPSQIKTNPVKPNPILTSLKINNREITAISANSPLKKSISETSEIELKHNQSSFALGFCSDNYLNPSKNKYAYRLVGYNDIWQYTYSNQVVFSNLDYDTYMFELKAANNDGIWSNDSRTLKIIIKPPWWRHPIALGFYFAIGILILFLIRNLILYRERMSAAIHLETVKRENEENIHKVKLQFFTNISHEFKTPLTLILSPIQRLISEKKFEVDVKEDLLLVQKNAERLKRLVNQFIEFRKIDKVQLTLHIAPMNLVELCEDVFSCFKELAEKRKIDFSFNQHIEPLEIWMDAEKIENVIFNALSNAFKYTDDGGQVQLNIRKGNAHIPELWETHQIGESNNQNYIYVEISDTGSGIEKDELDKIFERFYRSEKNSTKAGSGIGLSLAKEYTLLHKGMIKIASNPREGSVIIFGFQQGKKHLQEHTNIIFNDKKDFTLKTNSISLSEEIATATSSGKVGLPDSEKPLLLLIEDNVELNQYISKILSEHYKVVKSTNGDEGLALASRLLPELILSDVMLPGISGLQICESVKSDPLTSHIPVILFTARSDDSHRIEGIEMGADAYITKPVDIQLLKSTIRNLIEARKKLRLIYGGLEAATNKEEGLSTIDSILIKNAKKYIEENISNPDISTSELASELNMSRTNLHRKIKSLTGKTSTEFIRNIRINKAIELMEKDDFPISELGYAVGFNSTSYFTKCFKELYGVSPSTYKINADNFNEK